ncbi:heterochromatin protein 1-binding protein 3 isoform X2 [Synchiropus splendidus]|uniref:heterochromatin protein 1-binding protein 3 isoform X2 n=1 Tax=Synchiropus splendidus TaxID=270530 RepID=UPI00237DD4F1|nr:heterochromatin protein 1-binding protein 3 isoform X2 [Synchiropus splendidus]
MPIRRAAATPSQEKPPTAAPAEKEPVAAAEESPSTDEEQAEPSATAPEGEKNAEAGESKPVENGEKAVDGEGEKEGEATVKKGLKDGSKYEKGKAKKVKRTIPAWASVTASKKLPVTNYAGTQHKVDNILIEAVTSCTDRSGISYQSVMKFILKKYPGMELDKKKFLIKKAMKKHLEKGTIKQLKGKGLSGTFTIGKQPTSTKKTVQKQEALGDALPLIITRLCEPKEASYTLIKKYLEKHFPDFNIERRPDVLKSALVKAVEKGQLEQITGKGATGTFQLKRNSNQASQKAGPWDDALTAAITAMNEPKTCSTTSLRKYLLDSNKDAKEYQLVANLRRTLTKCKVLGWMEQISGHGFTGTYQLSFPFYPSPTVLYPDKFKDPPKKNTPAKRRKTSDSSDEDEESEEEEEEESEDEAPARKKQVQRRPPPKARRPPPAKKPKSKVVPRKSPAKKAVVSPRRTAVKKPAKASPVKKAAPASKPKSPAVKKIAKRPAARDASLDESVEVRETPRRGSKRPKYTDEDENESSDEPEVKEPPRKQTKSPAKKQAPKSGSKPAELAPAAKKGAKGAKQSGRKRGRK